MNLGQEFKIIYDELDMKYIVGHPVLIDKLISLHSYFCMEDECNALLCKKKKEKIKKSTGMLVEPYENDFDYICRCKENNCKVLYIITKYINYIRSKRIEILTFHENGRIKEKFYTIDDKREGLALTWDENGIQKHEQFFRQGDLVVWIKYDTKNMLQDRYIAVNDYENVDELFPFEKMIRHKYNKHINWYIHSLLCEKSNCYTECNAMKAGLKHFNSVDKQHKEECNQCKIIARLVIIHAENCEQPLGKCVSKFCYDFNMDKLKKEQKKMKKQQKKQINKSDDEIPALEDVIDYKPNINVISNKKLLKEKNNDEIYNNDSDVD